MRLRFLYCSFALFALIAFPWSAQAQFDIGRQLRDLSRIPKELGRPERGLPIERHLPVQSLRRALGGLAVAAVGVAILSSLSDRERREIARRVGSVVRSDPGREVVEVYELKKERKRVTIRVSPAQPKPNFADDPSLVQPQPKQPDDPKGGQQVGKKPETAGHEPVAYHTVSDDVPCRRVETTIASASTTKSDAPPPEATTATIVCELTEGDWKPVRK